MKKFLIFIFYCKTLFLFAQSNSFHVNPINDDTYLHPVDGITPYTFKKGEWFYAQSLQTLPGPGWALVGLTDKLTLQLDFTPLINSSLYFCINY